MRFAKFNRHNHRYYVLVHSNAILLVFSNEPNSDWGQGGGLKVRMDGTS